MEIIMNGAAGPPFKSYSDICKINAIDAALGVMDLYTRAHGRRVAIYAMRLARRMGLPPDEIENITLGGLLHDIGKVGLSERIFRNKKATLSHDMLEEVHRHPSIGVSILKDIEFLTPVIDYVHYHHERIDGNGYPCGLKAEEIPLGAKIISVADCFDAITTNRSYQKGKSRKEAFTILRESTGNCLCSELVEAFIEEIEENGMVVVWAVNRWATEWSAAGSRL